MPHLVHKDHNKSLGMSRVKAQALKSQQIKQLNKFISIGFACLVAIAFVHALMTQ